MRGETDGMGAVETDAESPRDSERLFGAGFWLACEREAEQMLRAITGLDDAHLTPPAGGAAP